MFWLGFLAGVGACMVLGVAWVVGIYMATVTGRRSGFPPLPGERKAGKEDVRP